MEEGRWVKEERKEGTKPDRQKGRQSSKRPRCPPRRTGWKQNLGTRHRFDLQTGSEVPSHGPPLPPTGCLVTLPMVTWRPEAPAPPSGGGRNPMSLMLPTVPHNSSHSTPPCPRRAPAELHGTQPRHTMHPTVPAGSPTELHRAPQCHTGPSTKTTHHLSLATWGFPWGFHSPELTLPVLKGCPPP